MIQEQPGIQIIGQIYPKLQTTFFHDEELLFAAQLFILTIPAGLTLSLTKIDLLIGRTQYLGDDRQTVFQPGQVFLIGHAMPAFVFRQIQLVLIAFDTEWEFGKIMIVNPVAAHRLAFGELSQVAEHLGQAVPEHLPFLVRHVSGDLYFLSMRNPKAEIRPRPPMAHHNVRKPKYSASCEPPVGPITCAVDQAIV